MYITTSKHASKELQALARNLVAHLPECRYLPRSERALERLQTLAARAGEHTLLVLSSPQTERPAQGKKKTPALATKKKSTPLPLAILSSRSRAPDGSWVWDDKTLSILKIKFSSPMPRLTSEDDPLEVQIATGPASHQLALFLGLAAGKRSPLFDDSTLITFKATAKKGEIKSGKTSLIHFDYSWC